MTNPADTNRLARQREDLQDANAENANPEAVAPPEVAEAPEAPAAPDSPAVPLQRPLAQNTPQGPQQKDFSPEEEAFLKMAGKGVAPAVGGKGGFVKVVRMPGEPGYQSPYGQTSYDPMSPGGIGSLPMGPLPLSPYDQMQLAAAGMGIQMIATALDVPMPPGFSQVFGVPDTMAGGAPMAMNGAPRLDNIFPQPTSASPANMADMPAAGAPTPMASVG